MPRPWVKWKEYKEQKFKVFGNYLGKYDVCLDFSPISYTAQIYLCIYGPLYVGLDGEASHVWHNLLFIFPVLSCSLFLFAPVSYFSNHSFFFSYSHFCTASHSPFFFFFSIFLLSNGNSHTGSQRAGTNFTGLFITMDLTCQSFECLSGNWRFERTEVVMKTGIIGRRSDVRLNVIFMKKLHPRSSVQWHLRENNQRRNVFIADLKVHLWFCTFFDWWEHWLFEDDGTMEKKRRTSWKEQKIKRKKKGVE